MSYSRYGSDTSLPHPGVGPAQRANRPRVTRGPASLSHTPAASAPQPAPRHAQPWPTCQPAPHASTGPLSPKPTQDRTISVARVCPSTDMLAPHVSTLSPLPFPLRATAAPEMTGEIAGIPSLLLPAAIPALLPLNLTLVSPCPLPSRSRPPCLCSEQNTPPPWPRRAAVSQPWTATTFVSPRCREAS